MVFILHSLQRHLTKEERRALQLVESEKLITMINEEKDMTFVPLNNQVQTVQTQLSARGINQINDDFTSRVALYLNSLRLSEKPDAQLLAFYKTLFKPSHATQLKLVENPRIFQGSIKQEVRAFYNENPGVNSLIVIFLGLMEICDGVNWDLGSGKILKDLSTLNLPCRKANNQAKSLSDIGA